jgi:hypothetical protein
MAVDTIRPLTVAATPVRLMPITRTAITGIGTVPTATGFTSLTDGRKGDASKVAPGQRRKDREMEGQLPDARAVESDT